MLDLFPLRLPGLVLLALMLGGMSFFTLVLAPLAFRTFGREQAGRFLTPVFPLYYRLMAALGLMAAAVLVPLWAAAVAAGAGLAFLALALVLIPRIERYRLGRQAEEPVARAAFARLHRLSVIANMALLLIVFGLFLHLAA